jgi:hypothetical protein
MTLVQWRKAAGIASMADTDTRTLVLGRYFTEPEDRHSAAVCLLGDQDRDTFMAIPAGAGRRAGHHARPPPHLRKVTTKTSMWARPRVTSHCGRVISSAFFAVFVMVSSISALSED